MDISRSGRRRGGINSAPNNKISLELALDPDAGLFIPRLDQARRKWVVEVLVSRRAAESAGGRQRNVSHHDRLQVTRCLLGGSMGGFVHRNVPWQKLLCLSWALPSCPEGWETFRDKIILCTVLVFSSSYFCAALQGAKGCPRLIQRQLQILSEPVPNPVSSLKDVAMKHHHAVGTAIMNEQTAPRYVASPNWPMQAHMRNGGFGLQVVCDRSSHFGGAGGVCLLEETVQETVPLKGSPNNHFNERRGGHIWGTKLTGVTACGFPRKQIACWCVLLSHSLQEATRWPPCK